MATVVTCDICGAAVDEEAMLGLAKSTFIGGALGGRDLLVEINVSTPANMEAIDICNQCERRATLKRLHVEEEA